ncbi:MAG TPA: beta-galactosidase [Puia sp.]|jgi:beta-galactosidase GanA|nr:beta-galactosidase [Puia sp.]
MKNTLLIVVLSLAIGAGHTQGMHRFSLGRHEFLLDGKPFQIISGEMHPARIPREYWLHRIRMAKAMGCNTIAVYVFWNYHEAEPGQWDFRSGNHDIAAFIRLCQAEGMWVLLRPGPYVCAEWDWGGLPAWLLKIPDIRVRCMDPRYMSAVSRYIARLSKEIVPLQCDHGGPILMVQVENEYGSYGNDRNYVKAVHRLWQEHGVTTPFYTADGPAAFMLEAGSLDSCAIGLDSGGGDADFAQAAKQDPDVPAFSSETYPGWLTHWKEPWQHPDTADIMHEVRYLLSHHRSFNLYVVHGGTNFGCTAGANAFSPTQYQPDVTSYDYDAPINEQGRPTPKYYALRRLIGEYAGSPGGAKGTLPPVPAPVPVMGFGPVEMRPAGSLWSMLGSPVVTATPKPMEAFGQSSGLILYRTRLVGHKSGKLTITEPHDFAMVFLNGKLIDTVYRDGGHWTVTLPETAVKEPVLDILVEAMGHINFAQYMIDRKGITDRVTLDGMTLMNWETYKLPMDEGFVKGLKGAFVKAAGSGGSAGLRAGRPGVFFNGTFRLDSVEDTYVDMSQFRKGVVWVNGHNLGRYWNVGPQLRLYCPASWLKKGENEVLVMDLLKMDAGSIKGVETLEGRGDEAGGGSALTGDAGSAVGGVEVTAVKRPDVGRVNSFYISNRSPLAPLNFIKLPVGSVEPGGWVRKYLELQRDGLTGHLGEISAWLEKKDNAWYSGTGEGSHGWEEVPYWLKGYGDLGYLLRDSVMIGTTRDWLEKVLQSQRADGYFGPRVIEHPGKDTVPDLWPNMLMLWCMQSYYEYSGDPRVLSFMTRYFRWEMGVPDGQLLRTYWENSRGGDNLYSIYWLYDHTGERWLLDLAAKIHRCTANWGQDTTLPNWHNVNIAQCFREPATYYMQTRDSANLRSTYNDFALIRRLYGQAPGGMFGADEDARKGYSDPRQAVETCGMVEQMSSDELLMGITGDAMWGDNCEDVAFNTYPAAVLPDFRGLRYLTAPNMVLCDDKDHSPGIENSGPFLLMNPFSSRCCQHNHSQGWPYYAEHLWMATPDNGVAALLYSDCAVKARVGDGVPAGIEETTHYPFDTVVRIRVRVESPVAFPLYLRIPGWCSSASVRVNGGVVDVGLSADGYAKIEKTWADGDEVELNLPMQMKVTRWEQNKGSVSVSYGPLSFSLKIKEDYVKVDSKASAIGDSKWQASANPAQWPAFEILPGSAWNYGLELGGVDSADGKAAAAADFEVVKKPWPKDDFPFTQDAAPIVIRAKGRKIPGWGIDQYGLCGVVPQSPVAVSTAEETIELIPMGAARLRISSFPVVGN